MAKASVIRRREATNAPRPLLNIAKVMEDNPTMLRLGEPETLEKIIDEMGSTSAFGGLGGVMDQMVGIKGGEGARGNPGGLYVRPHRPYDQQSFRQFFRGLRLDGQHT